MGVLIAYSSSAHRNLDLLPTREVPDRTGCPCRTSSYGVASASTARAVRSAAVSSAPADRRARGTLCGGPPGRGRPRQGAHRHPGRAAYRVDRGRIRPRPPRCAADRSWPLAPDTPHRCVRGMRGLASGQTRLSLPPRTDLTPSGDKSNGRCCDPRAGLQVRAPLRVHVYRPETSGRYWFIPGPGPGRGRDRGPAPGPGSGPGRGRRHPRRPGPGSPRCPGGCRCASR